MKKRLILFLLLTVTTYTNAQKWIQLGGALSEEINITELHTIEADTLGNVYVGGQMYDNSHSLVIAHWNGNQWKQIGGNFIGSGGVIFTSVLDKEGDLYFGGTISGFNNQGQGYIPFFLGKWDGSNWSVVNGLYGYYHSLATDDAGNIYAGGGFKDENQLNYVAKWDGELWSKFGEVGVNSMDYTEYSNNILSISMDHSNTIIAAGDFRDTNGKYYVARFDGENWVELGTGNNALNANSYIRSVVSDNDGNVYAIGDFTNSNGNKYLARWDGTSWSEVDLGKGDFYSIYTVAAIARDLSGNIYVAVNKIRPQYEYPEQDIKTAYITKWDGNSWTVFGGEDSLYTFLEGDRLQTIPPKARDIAIEEIKIDEQGNVYAAVSSWWTRHYIMKWVADTTDRTLATTVTKSSASAVKHLNVYPNPSAGVLTIPNVDEDIQMDVCNSIGDSVVRKLLDKGSNTIDLSDLAAGLYALKFSGPNTYYTTVKWIKQ